MIWLVAIASFALGAACALALCVFSATLEPRTPPPPPEYQPHDPRSR